MNRLLNLLLMFVPNRLATAVAVRLQDKVSLRAADSMIEALEARLGIGAGRGTNQSGENIVFRILGTFKQTNFTVFDVGANQGQYACSVIAGLGKDRCHEIHCFEPSNETFQQLSSKVSEYQNIRLNNFGLGSSQSTATLYMPKNGSGLASLTERRLDHFGIEHGAQSESVNISTLDSYCHDHQVQEIDILKIDVEGHELDVLEGGMNVLATGMAKIIQFEFGGCNIDTRTYFQNFFYLFAGYDYLLFRICPSELLFPIPKYRESEEKFRCTNFLAVQRELVTEAFRREFVI